MEFIPNVIRIWIFAFGIGLLICAILFNGSIQQHLSRLIPNHIIMVLTVIVLSLIICIITGLVITSINKKYEGRDQLRLQTDTLITDISQFVADRALSSPAMPTDTDRTSIDEWFQRNVQYSAITNNLFVSRFQQREMDLGYEYRQQGIITDEEWKHFSWVTQPEYPVIQWVLDTLKEYRSRIQ